MERMYVVARVAHPQPIAPSLPQVKRRGHDSLRHWIGRSINRPAIESFFSSILLGKRHIERLVWLGSRRTGFAKSRVIPMRWLRREPNRLALSTRALQHKFQHV